MLTILDLNAELAKLKMLRGRTPETPEADRAGAFARLAPYRDSAINLAKFSGEGESAALPGADCAVRFCIGTVDWALAASGNDFTGVDAVGRDRDRHSARLPSKSPRRGAAPFDILVSERLQV